MKLKRSTNYGSNLSGVIEQLESTLELNGVSLSTSRDGQTMPFRETRSFNPCMLPSAHQEIHLEQIEMQQCSCLSRETVFCNGIHTKLLTMLIS